MSYSKALVFSALTAALLSSASLAPAQVSVNIGVAPVCPYGYFDYAPYSLSLIHISAGLRFRPHAESAASAAGIAVGRCLNSIGRT